MRKLLIIIAIGLVSCEKESNCRYYTKGNLTLERKTGECYILQNGKKTYLKRETCANYCD
jgi:hypothetical protein